MSLFKSSSTVKKSVLWDYTLFYSILEVKLIQHCYEIFFLKAVLCEYFTYFLQWVSHISIETKLLLLAVIFFLFVLFRWCNQFFPRYTSCFEFNRVYEAALTVCKKFYLWSFTVKKAFFRWTFFKFHRVF